MRPNPVQTLGIPNKRHTVGVAYIIIPDDIDRDTYVQDCLRRGRVSIQTEDGDVVLDCPVGLSILQQLEFPPEVEQKVDQEVVRQLGSCVLFVNEYRHNKPIITDRLIKDDESTNYVENEFKLEKYTENGSVVISGIAKDGNLFISVSGKGENGGKIFIDAAHPENEGAIVVNLQGNFQMELQAMVLNMLKGLNIVTKEDININAEGEDAEGVKAVINLGDTEEGVEPVLLGDKTIVELNKEVQALTDLITSIAGIVPVNVTTGSPDPTWATWQAAVALIISRGNLSDVKSEKTFSE